jgi:hypothetical protein
VTSHDHEFTVAISVAVRRCNADGDSEQRPAVAHVGKT